jgi:hypothetical protein
VRPRGLNGISMHPQALARLAEVADVRPLPSQRRLAAAAVAECDGVIAYVPPLDAAALVGASTLKVISCLIGFGSATSGASAWYDRLLYLDSGAQLTFGTSPSGTPLTIRSPAGTTYKDGAWHHVAASLGGAGAKAYLDGGRVTLDTSITTAGSYAGYWRWGGDTLAGSWPNQPTNDSIVGTIDEVVIFSSQLTDQQIAWHYYANH